MAQKGLGARWWEHLSARGVEPDSIRDEASTGRWVYRGPVKQVEFRTHIDSDGSPGGMDVRALPGGPVVWADGPEELAYLLETLGKNWRPARDRDGELATRGFS